MVSHQSLKEGQSVNFSESEIYSFPKLKESGKYLETSAYYSGENLFL
jgi:hypothetical protein